MARHTCLQRPPAHWPAPLIVGAVLLAACGGSTPPPSSSTVGIVTPSGLRYTFKLTVRDGKACATQTYAVVRKHVKDFPQTSRFCGPAGHPAPPTLIQVADPATTLIVDRPSVCTPVAVARSAGRPQRVSSKCSPAAPFLRITLLPPGRVFRTIAGIPGLTTLDFSRSPCSFICNRQLTH